MEVHFDPELFNGVLVVQAPDEETSDRIRSTFTDIRMWEKVEDEEDELESLTEEEFADKLIASSILSETAKEDLQEINPDIRTAIERLIADGELMEENGRYRLTEKGKNSLRDK
jgi:Lon protease-like protein